MPNCDNNDKFEERCSLIMIGAISGLALSGYIFYKAIVNDQMSGNGKAAVLGLAVGAAFPITFACAYACFKFHELSDNKMPGKNIRFPLSRNQRQANRRACLSKWGEIIGFLLGILGVFSAGGVSVREFRNAVNDDPASWNFACKWLVFALVFLIIADILLYGAKSIGQSIGDIAGHRFFKDIRKRIDSNDVEINTRFDIAYRVGASSQRRSYGATLSNNNENYLPPPPPWMLNETTLLDSENSESGHRNDDEVPLLPTPLWALNESNSGPESPPLPFNDPLGVNRFSFK